MKSMTRLLVLAMTAVAFVSTACGENSDTLTADDGPGQGAPGGPGSGASNPSALDPLPEGTTLAKPGLRRLTKRELESSIRDAFGLGPEWAGVKLSPDRASDLGFDNDRALLEIDEDRTNEISANAESAADAILTQKKLASLPACATLGKECAAAAVDAYGPRLFRRALTAEEKTRFADLFATVAGQATPEVGVKWVLVGMLGAPSFLYRSEIGEAVGSGRVALSGEEIATELAYTFGGTLPSPELLERGRKGELFAAEARVKEASALLSTPRGREVLADFGRQWLRYEEVNGIAKDETVVPGFTKVRGDMVEETRRFLEYVMLEKKGSLRDLFTSGETFVTPALATHYGYSAPGADGKTQRPADQAIGILAHGSLLSRYGLAAGTSPSQRGAFVRRKLLCKPLPPPPPNVGEPPHGQQGLTTRELYEKIHAAQPTCGGCHGLIDPVGFGLEHFDVAGRYRTAEIGKPIDPSGKVAGLASGSPSFADHKGLSTLLAETPEVADCMSTLLSAYAFGVSDSQKLALPEAREALRAGSGPLVDFFAQLAAAPSFAVREEAK